MSIQNLEETQPFKSPHVSSYTELLKRVKAAGLLVRDPGFYLKRLAVIALLSGVAWAGLVVVSGIPGGVWFAIPIVMLLGILSAQFGFIGHEAAHRQVFNSNKANDVMGIILANLFAGLSYSFWIRKHNRHHNKPNQIGYDPDIAIRVLSFTPESLKAKTGVERKIAQNQGWLFPFLLFFTGFDLLLDSFVSAFRKGNKLGKVEFVLMMIRQITPFIIFTVLFNVWIATGLWLAMMLTFGFFMGAAFAPNHKGMPLVPKDAKIDFLQRQVLTSRNITPSWLKDNLMGGLNYQVEHHLFPSMSRSRLKEAQKIIKSYCAELGLPIVEMSWTQSIGEVIRYLDKVGLSDRDPFVCPMVATLRPRS